MEPPPRLLPVPGPAGPSLEPAGLVAGVSRRIALLFGGPSLLQDWPGPEGFDEIVAVNGAAWLVSCDYAVGVDHAIVNPILDGTKPRPRVAMVTYESMYRRHRGKLIGRNGVAFVEIPRVSGTNVKSYTAPRALLFALRRCGPRGMVSIFGMDFSGEPVDVAGVPGTHNGQRWRQEAEVLRLVWDLERIVAVQGKIDPGRLAYIQGRVAQWPG